MCFKSGPWSGLAKLSRIYKSDVVPWREVPSYVLRLVEESRVDDGLKESLETWDMSNPLCTSAKLL